MDFTHKDSEALCVCRGAAARKANADILLVTSCHVQTSTWLFKCVTLSRECYNIVTMFIYENRGCCERKKSQTKSHGYATEKQKTQIEAKRLKLNLAWFTAHLQKQFHHKAGLEHKVLHRTISGLNCRRQYDVVALRQRAERLENLSNTVYW